MKGLFKRAGSAVMSAALICTMPFTSVSQVVTAVDNTEIDEDEYYTINSYNKDDIVFDEEGAVVKGHAYCLDYKCHTPAGQKFKACKLSELTTLEKEVTEGGKTYTYTRNYTDAVKNRLLKIVIADDQIKAYAKTLNADTARANIISKKKNLKSEEAMKEDWNKLLNEAPQYLVWACVHDDSEWANWVTDKDQEGHADFYCFKETSNTGYGYESDSPLTDEDSLWSVYFKPLIEYIDNEIEDYYYEGYDGYVFNGPKDHQSMICGAFKRGDFDISKVSITNGNELSGAELTVTYNGEGADLSGVSLIRNGYPVECTISEDGKSLTFVSGKYPTTLSGLPEGDYTLTEVAPPNTYSCAEDIDFHINADGTHSVNGADKVTNRIVMVDKPLAVQVTKLDFDTGDELDGAEFALYYGSDFDEMTGELAEGVTPIETWISGGDVDEYGNSVSHVIGSLTADTEYVIRETSAPEYYTVCPDIHFTVDINNVVYVDGKGSAGGEIVINDKISTVGISKKDIANENELENAVLTLTGDADWDFVMSKFTQDDIEKYGITFDVEINGITWTSADEELYVKGLKFDTDYVLTEKGAPDGYEYTDDITFSLTDSLNGYADVNVKTKDGESVSADGIVSMFDAATDITVQKVDAETGKPINSDAVFEVLKGEEIVCEITVNGSLEIQGLFDTLTEYTLHEKTAPDGYDVAEDIKFTLDTDGTVIIDGKDTDAKVLYVEDAKLTADDSSSDTDSDNSSKADNDSSSNGSGTDGDSSSSSSSSSSSTTSKGTGTSSTTGGSSDGNPATGLGKTAAPILLIIAAAAVIRKKNS
ncbi:hypothetical protein SAMN02910447_02176 [Ruminococcus sp. YE71]|uniref:SpaA isopeptide-forming pilin-related protein n=1 Tax=unclassified Ruminococcus TaxID=2608920 RepID=UPI00088BD9B5|nr:MULTISPECIES: SpaA isopeptide-forming pilin-related protein [unclassified Ruminococcus]SDA22253.1 hypothetical protein SAMN02910446_02045 [Ruminococcus sp. YE78]SFW37709.1 hypothetical protein SAMN02910447_02176 [Ruminococcus sp. YE71]